MGGLGWLSGWVGVVEWVGWGGLVGGLGWLSGWVGMV